MKTRILDSFAATLAAEDAALRYRGALETVAQWDAWAEQRLRELDYRYGPLTVGLAVEADVPRAVAVGLEPLWPHTEDGGIEQAASDAAGLPVVVAPPVDGGNGSSEVAEPADLASGLGGVGLGVVIEVGNVDDAGSIHSQPPRLGHTTGGGTCPAVGSSPDGSAAFGASVLHSHTVSVTHESIAQLAHRFAMKYGLLALPDRAEPMTYLGAVELEAALSTFLRVALGEEPCTCDRRP